MNNPYRPPSTAPAVTTSPESLWQRGHKCFSTEQLRFPGKDLSCLFLGDGPGSPLHSSVFYSLKRRGLKSPKGGTPAGHTGSSHPRGLSLHPLIAEPCARASSPDLVTCSASVLQTSSHGASSAKVLVPPYGTPFCRDITLHPS